MTLYEVGSHPKGTVPLAYSRVEALNQAFRAAGQSQDEAVAEFDRAFGVKISQAAFSRWLAGKSSPQPRFRAAVDAYCRSHLPSLAGHPGDSEPVGETASAHGKQDSEAMGAPDQGNDEGLIIDPPNPDIAPSANAPDLDQLLVQRIKEAAVAAFELIAMTSDISAEWVSAYQIAVDGVVRCFPDVMPDRLEKLLDPKSSSPASGTVD